MPPVLIGLPVEPLAPDVVEPACPAELELAPASSFGDELEVLLPQLMEPATTSALNVIALRQAVF
ncbi:MAG TPA: hypothetical protein VNW92_10910, partial [Polyangiaceae bacterium]|nr:hypothetical protein [Polyangiaceae bacterium]